MPHPAQHTKIALLPDSGQDLLRSEIAQALGQLGYTVIRPHPTHLLDTQHEHYLPRLIKQKPKLFFSVNMQGLFPGAPHTRMLLDAGITTLAWFVDNPWNILSAMRDPSWKELELAVTDATFIQPLQKCGAPNVMHLPLAVGEQHMLGTAGQVPAMADCVFVGRTFFPDMESFFAGQELPAIIEQHALELITQGFGPGSCRPDFAWWLKQLGLNEQAEHLWPGKKARKPGKGAALCNVAWREACLNATAASAGGLTVFGDKGWGKLPNLSDLRPPVDYYTHLPAIYRAAKFSLNLNSLLLPAGLSQRIFDIWAAQGFCLSDWSQGLNIFPQELTDTVCFFKPEDIPALAEKFNNNLAYKEEVRHAWRKHILAEHTYTKRLSCALEQLSAL